MLQFRFHRWDGVMFVLRAFPFEFTRTGQHPPDRNSFHLLSDWFGPFRRGGYRLYLDPFTLMRQEANEDQRP